MDLRSQALESLDLPGALSRLAEQMTAGAGPLVEVRTEGPTRRLDAAHEHHLLRIGLEALTNALRHADASRVDVTVTFRADAVELTVSDDGRGLARAAMEGAGAHFGIQGIRERVGKLGGRLTIDSAPGRGDAGRRQRAGRVAGAAPAPRGAVGAMAAKLKILLVDDHYLVRMGLASILALEPDMAVCAEAASGEQALALYREHRPDVTLMDLRLPGLSGTETAHRLRAEFPEARIVMISTYACDEEIYGALQAGALAYLVKSVQREELTRAVRKAAAGQRHIPAEIASRLADRVTRSQLSAREIDVGGRRNREIAAALDISEGTVKLHVSSILGKLGVADRTEAVTRALQRGIVQLEM
jgi:two-component system NarL family response regulator